MVATGVPLQRTLSSFGFLLGSENWVGGKETQPTVSVSLQYADESDR
jgi:hypothetical protein